MPEETPLTAQDRPVPDRPAAHRRKRSRPRRYGFLVGWITVTTGTIVASSFGLQAALRADDDRRPVRAPAGALHPTPSPSTSAETPASPLASSTGPPLAAAAPHEAPASSRPAGSARPKVAISSPGERARVPGEKGVLLSGTATDLGDLTLHIFDLADNGRYYPGTLEPVAVQDGHWSFRKHPIGQGAEDVGQTFTMIAALGDDACRSALRSAPVDKYGDRAFEALPGGCREMDRVRVVKARP